MNTTALREQALAAEKRGDLAGARALFTKLADISAADPSMLNSIAGFFLRQSDAAMAEALYRKAAQAAPRNGEFAINHAIALTRLGRRAEALALLKRSEPIASGDPRYWSARAAEEREAGDLAGAEASYNRCLSLQPAHPRALHGRARVALERSDPDSPERFNAALAAQQGDLELWLGYAQALELTGDLTKAIEIAELLVRQAPAWIEALNVLTQFRLARGDADFTSHYQTAQGAAPDEKSISLAHCNALSGLDHFAAAADVAERAAQRFLQDEVFQLLHAINSGAAGDDAKAESIFASLGLQTTDRKIHEARHHLRKGDADRAEALLAEALARDDANIAAWALRGICWRLQDDARLDWLYGADGFVRPLPLDLPQETFAEVRHLLHSLHDGASLPLGQSVRGGTQTRGALFARREPELGALQQSLLRALEVYRAGLPPYDPTHPLLRHRVRPWHIFGSWSVRLPHGGRHTEHIHPQGIISSALYVDLHRKDEADPKAGWLELGRPAPDLRLDLPPLFEIEPEEGRLALFPSTLYHGTRRFSEGRRMTVAYDVAPLM